MSADLSLAPTAGSARALADAALLRVLERMASPLRHELAGGLLVPQMQLQMLRRKLTRASADDSSSAAAAIDDILRQLQELRALHEATVAWLSLHDTRPLALAGELGKVTAAFALPFGAREIGLHCEAHACDLVFPAQPMLLLLHAGFWAVLDALPARECAIRVGCRREGQGALVEWRLSSAATATGLASPPTGAALTIADVAALCARFGARFGAGLDCWQLQLPAPAEPDAGA